MAATRADDRRSGLGREIAPPHEVRRMPGPGSGGAKDELYGDDPGPPHSPAGVLQPLRRRAQLWADRAGHGPCAAGAGGAAHRGAQDRGRAHGPGYRRGVPLRADPRCSSAADGEPAGGGAPAPRSAQVPKIPSSSHRSCRRRVPSVQQTAEQLVEVLTIVSFSLCNSAY